MKSLTTVIVIFNFIEDILWCLVYSSIDDPVFWDRVLLSQQSSSVSENERIGGEVQSNITASRGTDTPPGRDVMRVDAQGPSHPVGGSKKGECQVGGVKRKKRATPPSGDDQADV